jgi:hypothetical protein
VCGGTVDQRRTDTGDGEVRFVLLDEFVCGLLSESFGCTVRDTTVGILLCCYLIGNGIPIFFGISIAWSGSFPHINNRGERGGDDDSLHVGVVLPDGIEDLISPFNGWIEKITLIVLDLHDEWGCGMNNTVNVLHGFIMSTWESNILDDSERKLVEILAVGLLDFLCCLLTSDSSPDVVTAG